MKFKLDIDLKELKKQINAVNESNVPIDIKEGVHNLLGAIRDKIEDDKKNGYYDIECDFGTCEEEFKRYVGRKPKDGEMEDWVNYNKKGIDSQLDWDVICKCASDNFDLEL